MGKTILDVIGNTPLVEIQRLNPNPKVRIFAKIEYMNPGGSIKDRPALAMIEAGERSGQLTPDKTVIEATSGNTGIGLAMVCSVKGYRLLLTMPESVSIERRKILSARGAEILLTPGHLATDGAIEEAYRLAREHPEKYFMTDQYNNEANWMAHYLGTAEEIIRQTDGELSMFVGTMGTTGTLMGISRRLREYDPKIRIIGVEPYFGHKLQGLKNLKESYRPEIFAKQWLDEKVNIDDEPAFEMTRRLGREEGLFVGMSSGAAMAVAVQKAAAMEGGTIVTIFPDSGERYLSTPIFEVKKRDDIRLFNTMSRSVEPFEPLKAGRVSIYSCGPTADARMNIAQCRRYVFADILCRYLSYRGYDVTHIMNITDYDDKTIKGSEAAGEDLAAFTQRYIDLFKKDLAALKIRPADEYPKASEHVNEMVEITRDLVDMGAAYEKMRCVYFNIGALDEYGGLSGIDLNKIRLGATVDLDDYEKNNPKDFTLLKRVRLSDLKRGLYVKTKWGNVRPSWHIQCAAMSMKYLGETFDIHTSSRDLLFPHHENEMAIARALTGKPLARYWLHSERVEPPEPEVGGEKQAMPGLDLLFEEGYTAREIRFWLLSGHYRKPLTFDRDRLIQARNTLNRLDACVQALLNVSSGEPYPEIDQLVYDIKQGLIHAMDDDLNMPHALAAVFKAVRQINRLIDTRQLDAAGAGKILESFRDIDQVLKIFDFSPARVDSDAEDLMAQRAAARKRGDFAEADRIRDELKARGIEVHDQKIGRSE